MSNTIQPDYGTKACSIPAAKVREPKGTGAQAKTQANSFLNMAIQANQSKANALIAGLGGIMGLGGINGMGGIAGMSSINGLSGITGLNGIMGLGGIAGLTALPASSMIGLLMGAAGQHQAWGTKAATGTEAIGSPEAAKGADSTGGTDAAGAVGATSLETMLKAKYPGIHYHVFDASSSYWKTRNDYPHYLLYQDGDKAKEAMENWKPDGDNPFYGSIDGRFIAPKEIHELSNVPPGSKAVVIHPKVQERMEQDPAYAQEIFAKIDTWFNFDVARNEAILPGSTWDMSQAVAIGEDGNICNACSSSANGEITCSGSGAVNGESWWDRRTARHAEMMKLIEEKQIQRRIETSDLLSASAAKAQLASMINSGELLKIFGSEIAGVPTETVLAITQAQIFGGGGIL